MVWAKIKKIAVFSVSLENLERIRALQDYFYNREMGLQDKNLSEGERLFLSSPKTRFAGSFFNIDPSSSKDIVESSILDRIKRIASENRGVPVTNVFLGDKTPEDYSEPSQEIASPNLIPLLRKLGSRIGKFGEQYVDNVPGLSSLGQATGDDTDSAAGAAIQAGGRVLPILGAAWLGLNAGPTAAGTLEDARVRGYVR